MAATTPPERPREAVDVAKQYRRRERALSAAVVALATGSFLGAYLTTSLVPAVVVGAVLVVALRAPILESAGTVRLRTDDDPAAVVEEFDGPTPPVLPFLWGAADEIAADGEPVRYRLPYLFGLRAVEVTVRTRTDATSDGRRRVTVEVATNDDPWATYTATIDGDGDGTVVDVEYASDRRFGLRRLPQQFVAKRYRDAALAAQGYTVVERNSRVGV